MWKKERGENTKKRNRNGDRENTNSGHRSGRREREKMRKRIEGREMRQAQASHQITKAYPDNRY